jgi:uncharacterized integral membrane protein
MNRLVFVVVAILAVAIGLLVGTLNASAVELDLLWVQLNWPLGLLILLFFSSGLLLGLALMFLSHVLPLRLKLRRVQAKAAKPESQGVAVTND